MTFTATENKFWSEDYQVNDKPIEQWNHREIINFMLNAKDTEEDEEIVDQIADYLINSGLFCLTKPVRYSSRIMDYGNEDSYMANLTVNPEIETYSRQWDRAVLFLQIPYSYKFLRSLLPRNTSGSAVYIDDWDRKHSLLKYRIYCSIGD